MALSFNKKTAEQILKEYSYEGKDIVYAYGVKAGFSLFVPKQIFVIFNGTSFTVCHLSAFHSVKTTEKIALKDISNFKFNKGLTGGMVSFKLSGKKVRYEFLKNLITLKNEQKEFLSKMGTVANEL